MTVGHLPINLDDLLSHATVESDRIEYKAGWNPDPIIRTLCAFANDFENLGGGYIIVGLEAKDGMVILSYPGPDLSIRIETLKQERILARRYRNRRIGEFLKELKLTEGRCTGIPKIRKAMRENGSPEPIYSHLAAPSFSLWHPPSGLGLSTGLDEQPEPGVVVEPGEWRVAIASC